MLQFGGGFPSEWGNPDVVELDCMDKTNAVTIGAEADSGLTGSVGLYLSGTPK